MDEKLAKAINSRKMVALVGSGASVDAGLPDWKGLCARIVKFAAQQPGDHGAEYQNLFESCQYGELMEVIGANIGRTILCQAVADELSKAGESDVHKFLARFPFAFYLTTNYDDLILSSLRKEGVAFAKLYNTAQDFSTIDVNTKDVVVKLHGDFQKPETMVLTSSDFSNLAHEPGHEAFRTKLGSVLTMFDVLAVGYSFRDPHLAWILERLSHIFKGGKPLFAIMADAEAGDVARYRRTFNVEVLSYKTVNGSHLRLLHMFKAIEPFVLMRKARALDYEGPSPEQIEDANQLFLFTTFHVKPESVDFKLGAYRALIVSVLGKAKAPLKKAALVASLPLGIAKIADKVDALVEVTLKNLEGDGNVKRLLDGSFELTPNGIVSLAGNSKKYQLALERFISQAEVDVRTELAGIEAEALTGFVSEMIACVNQIFYLRGVEIAGSIFDARHVSMAGGYDILRVINGHAAKSADQAHSLFFMKYLQGLISNPTSTQQEYLWHLSQAYFSYHALNLDPACNKMQRDILKRTLFVVDSNVVLPYLAEGTFNFSAATELFQLAAQLDAQVCITKGVLREVVKHARFAAAIALRDGTDSTSFLEAALGKGGFRQNLFIDGFIRLADKIALDFDQYIRRVLGSEDRDKWMGLIEAKLAKLGIPLVEPERFFTAEDLEMVEKSLSDIRTYRETRGTYRDDDQCQTEAEIDSMITLARSGRKEFAAFENIERVHFVSQSRVLDHVDRADGERRNGRVWRPETFFRYLSCFSRAVPEKNIWQQFLASDVYQAGLPIIDQAKYKKFFSGAIRQSEMDFHSQKETLERIGEQAFAERVQGEFLGVSDFEKPLFVESLEAHLERLIAGAKVLTKKDRQELTDYRAQAKAKKEFIKRQQRRANLLRKK